MVKNVLAMVAGVAILGGCASQSDWQPTIDTYGNSRSQYLTRDLDECRAIAQSAIGTATEDTTLAATVGGVAGAVGGMVLGGMLGRPGRGLALGAASGAIAGGGIANAQSQEQFETVYSDCMRERGHNVTS